MPAVSMIGWVLTVRLSSSAGPSSTSFQRSCPIASEASEKVARTPGSPEKDTIMPTDCEPCPGNTKAIFMVSRLPAQQDRAPCEAAPPPFEQKGLARKYAAVFHRLIQGQGYGCGGSVAVMVN